MDARQKLELAIPMLVQVSLSALQIHYINYICDLYLKNNFILFVNFIVDSLKEIVNGDHTRNGANVASLVMEGPKTERESCSKLLSMEEWTVLDKPPNSETVTCMDAQVCQ